MTNDDDVRGMINRHKLDIEYWEFALQEKRKRNWEFIEFSIGEHDIVIYDNGKEYRKIATVSRHDYVNHLDAVMAAIQVADAAEKENGSARTLQRELLAVIREIAEFIPDLHECENGNGESLHPLALKIHDVLNRCDFYANILY